MFTRGESLNGNRPRQSGKFPQQDQLSLHIYIFLDALSYLQVKRDIDVLNRVPFQPKVDFETYLKMNS